MLFNKLLEERSRRSVILSWLEVTIKDPGYADDIGLLSEPIRQEQPLQTRLELDCAEVGLRLKKKKRIPRSWPITFPRTPAPDNNIGELAVKEVNHLSTWVHELHLMASCTWLQRKGQLHSFQWCDYYVETQITPAYQDQFLPCKSVLLYGCECWTQTEGLQKSLNLVLNQNAMCGTEHQPE